MKSILVNSVRKSESVDLRKNSHTHGVSFSHATIYEFPVVLGDNPAVSGGSPLTIGWKHIDQDTIDLDFLEFSKKRRTKKQLLMKAGERDLYLLSLGYTLEQLMKISEECKSIRDSRRENMKLNDNWANKLMYGLGNAAVKTGNAGVKVLKLPGAMINEQLKSFTKTQPRMLSAKSA